MQVLCASNAAHDQVDPLQPPQDAALGERVCFEGCDACQDFWLMQLLPALGSNRSMMSHGVHACCCRFNSSTGQPEQLNPKKKVFEKIAAHLKTNSGDAPLSVHERESCTSVTTSFQCPL